jgi:hypothetical protein
MMIRHAAAMPSWPSFAICDQIAKRERERPSGGFHHARLGFISLFQHQHAGCHRPACC